MLDCKYLETHIVADLLWTSFSGIISKTTKEIYTRVRPQPDGPTQAGKVKLY